PNVGDSFVIMTYGSHIGEFQTVNGLIFDGGTKRFDVHYDSTDVTLTVVSNTSTSAPTVTAVSPNTGGTGGRTSVTLPGTNFVDVTDVQFGNTPADSFTVNSSTSITATSPSHGAGTVDITVTTPYGTSATSTADQFNYTLAPAPAITQITPTSGPTDG